MKVLCLYSHGGSSFVRTSWGKVFQACGHDFMFWNPQEKCAFDAFNEFEPNVFIGTSYDVDNAIEKCIRNRPEMRVALFASAWGPLVDNLDRQKYPIVYVTDEEKRRLEKLKKDTGKPDYVFIHVTDKYLLPTMGNWREIGIEPKGILNAACTFSFSNATFRPELACDVGFVGGRWAYKGRNIDKFLLPLCSLPLNIKIFGNTEWPVAQFLGYLQDHEVKDLFVSATVCPSISESHSTDLSYDIVERNFKVPYAKGMLVSDYVDEINEVFGKNVVPMAKTPSEFKDLIYFYIENKEKRQEKIDETYKIVSEKHTYWERVAKMFNCLNLSEESVKVLNKKKEFINASSV